MTGIVQRGSGEVFFEMTSTLQIQKFLSNSRDPNLTATIYPISIDFRQAKRITKRDNLDGSVIQHFNNRFNNNNDLLELTIKASTKNIDGTVTGSPDDDGERLDNLENFYTIMALAEEPPFISGNEFNYIDLTFCTPIQRAPINLYAVFKEMPKFTEDASKQKVVEFTMDFWILNKNKIKYEELYRAVSAWRRSIRASGSRARGLSDA